MTTAYLWTVTPRVVVNHCGRFGTSFRSHLQELRRWDRQVVPTFRQGITSNRPGTDQKNVDLFSKPNYLKRNIVNFFFIFIQIKISVTAAQSDEIIACTCTLGGPGSLVGIATDYGLDGPGSNPGGDEIF